ncbi:CatB-related O-acetyltransferase [Olsenella intestinalis]|uniref:CatB-related O-acetyltransferase n=1 Tax=Olsenella intestinalis TaxID=2930083 RepID=UPI002010AAD6
MLGFKQFLIAKKNQIEWRLHNRHNETSLSADCSPRVQRIAEVGAHTYGVLKVYASNNTHKLSIGSYCSIGPGVAFVLNNEHQTDSASTFPFKVKLLGQSFPESGSKGGITVGDDVWFGYGATVLDGVSIGQGAVIGAGALVTKDVPPYAIVVGLPAEIIRYRYDEPVVKLMEQVDWALVDEKFVRDYTELLYRHPLTQNDALELLDSMK